MTHIIDRINTALDLWDFQQVDILFNAYHKEAQTQYFHYLFSTGRFHTIIHIAPDNAEFSQYVQENFAISVDVLNNFLQEIFTNPQNSLESLTDSNAVFKAYIANYIIENLLQNEINHHKQDLKNFLIYFYESCIHQCENPISFGFYTSKMLRYFLTLRDEKDFFVPVQPFATSYKILHKLYNSNQEGARIFFNIFNARLRKYLSVWDKCDTMLAKPKIAICLYGILRGNYLKALENISAKLALPLNADLFLFTWDEYHLWPGLGGGYNWIERKCTKDFAKEVGIIGDKNFLIQNFRNTALKLETEYLVKLTQEEIQKISQIPNFKHGELGDQSAFDNTPSPNHAKLFYGIYKSFEVMQNYEKMQNFQYDYVIITRIDIEPVLNLDNFHHLTSLKPNQIDTPVIDYGGSGTGSAFGTRYAMQKHAQLFLKRHLLAGDMIGWIDDNHQIFFKWEVYNGLEQVKTNFITFDLIGQTSVVDGFAFPNITKELAEDIETLKEKFSPQEIQSFKKAFQKVKKHFKTMQKTGFRTFNKIWWNQ